MTTSYRDNGPTSDRLDDLLADQALFGLSEAEQAELDALLLESDLTGDEYDIVATEVQLASTVAADEDLSDSLRERILAASSATPSTDSPATLALPSSQPSSRNWAGLMLLAASILFAAFILRPAPQAQSFSPEQLQASLTAAEKQAGSQVIRVSWTRGADETAKTAEGEVLWDPKTQQGIMRFHGLAKNDPTKEQYQLWIFDADRNEAHPVDGGVFDIADANADTLIPIDARVPVNEATLFAITVERPGGVVVSSRERLPLLAPVKG
ncbi:MAG: anti-sigma factor [Lacipirellulaceae bacterium]